MDKYSSTDAIVARDRGGRRRFLQRGATALAAGAIVVSTRHALAADCDQYTSEESARCSDSDAASNTGSGGDPAVCGCPSPDAPARHELEDRVPESLLKVARVR